MYLLCFHPQLAHDSFCQLSANVVYIDKKIKFRLSPKTGVALKLLRSQISALLSAQMRIKPLSETQLPWNELAIMILGKLKPEEPGRQLESITLVKHS